MKWPTEFNLPVHYYASLVFPSSWLLPVPCFSVLLVPLSSSPCALASCGWGARTCLSESRPAPSQDKSASMSSKRQWECMEFSHTGVHSRDDDDDGLDDSGIEAPNSSCFKPNMLPVLFPLAVGVTRTTTWCSSLTLTPEGWHWTTTSWSIPTVHSTRRPMRALTLRTFWNHSSVTCAERIARFRLRDAVLPGRVLTV